MRNKRTDVHRECNTVGNRFVRVGKIILRRIREKERERLSIKKYDAEVFFPRQSERKIIAKIKEKHSHDKLLYFCFFFFYNYKIKFYKIIPIIVRASLFFFTNLQNYIIVSTQEETF